MALSSTVPFLKLPPELRAEIYSYLLCPTPGKAITLYHSHSNTYSPATLNIHPAILRSNKKIYHEALPLLHSNTYGFDFFEITQRINSIPEGSITTSDTSANLNRRAVQSRLAAEDKELLWTGGRVDQDSLRPLEHVEIRTNFRSVWSVEREPSNEWSRTRRLLELFVLFLIERCVDDQEYTGAFLQRTLVFRVVMSRRYEVEYFLVKGGGNGSGAEKTVTYLEAVRGTGAGEGGKVGRIDVHAFAESPQGRSLLAKLIIFQLMGSW